MTDHYEEAAGAPDPDGGSTDTSFFGHPRGLLILFLTEMWERFSYYGMRALLIFYLTQHFLFTDQRSSLIYGAYTALVYVMPVIGGALADRYLGSRKAVTFGAILLVLGHFGMAFEGRQADQVVDYDGGSYQLVTEGRGDEATRFLISEAGRTPVTFAEEGLTLEDGPAAGLPDLLASDDYELRVERGGLFLAIFYFSLALIISGVGFLKANISTIVGALYAKGDPRRDAGFTIFYMGINLGSFLAVLACGYLGQTFGWKYGFGLAGLGMLAGLVVFLWGQRFLEGRAEPPDPAKLKEKAFGPVNKEWAVYLGGVLMVLVSWVLIMNEAVVGDLLRSFGLLMLAVIIWLSLFVFGKPAGKANSKMQMGVFLAGFVIMAIPVLLKAAQTFGLYSGDLPWTLTWLPLGVGFALIGVVIAMDILGVESVDRDRMLVATFLIMLQLPFWALFEQAGSSLNLFTDRAVNRELFGWDIPASMFQSLNAFFIFTLAPLFAWGWISLARRGQGAETARPGWMGASQVALGAWWLIWALGNMGVPVFSIVGLGEGVGIADLLLLLVPTLGYAAFYLATTKRNAEPPTPVKFSLGLLQVGLGFVVLVMGIGLTGTDGLTPMIWIVLLYLLHTTGELCLSPVGLSMVTKLSIGKIVGMMMGAWFLASGFANYIAGLIAAATGAETVGGEIVDLAAAKANYMDVYLSVGVIAVAIAAVVLMVSPMLKKGMHGVH